MCVVTCASYFKRLCAYKCMYIHTIVRINMFVYIFEHIFTYSNV